VYWAEDGRTSVDAVFAAVAVAGLLILGFNPLSFFDVNIWREDSSFWPRALVVAGAVLGRGVLGVVDGASPLGVETDADIAWRKDLLRKIGYKL
jgi:hypothetical protein